MKPKAKKTMLLQDYGKIIIMGLCNSPNHLNEYFKREVAKLADQHYPPNEVEDKLRQVVALHKQRIKEIFDADNKSFLKYSKEDLRLSGKNKYNYPAPKLEEIAITELRYPSGAKNIFPKERKYFIKDFEAVEKAITFVFNNLKLAPNHQKPNGLETVLLEETIRLLGYWMSDDESVIEELLKGDNDLIKNLFEPLAKEINRNLLSKDTLEAKENLIRYYIFEFWSLQAFFDFNNKTIYHNPNNAGEVLLKSIDDVETNYEKYVIYCFEYLSIIFTDIQLSCIKYKIDFFKICNDLNFSTKYFDCGVTLAFEEKQNEILPPQQTETKTGQEIPKSFEELFYNPEHAEPCLKILSELQPPVIDAINNYIGKAKGVFPLWVKVLKNHKPKPLIKQFNDIVYKDLLNQKVNGLNLSKDASEFRKQYKRVGSDIELDIKTILSQYSQSGKLGK